MKELFQSRAKEEDEENQAKSFYKKFMGQGPSYYGDLDEKDGSLLKFEEEAEEEGTCLDPWEWDDFVEMFFFSDWELAYANLRDVLGLPENDPPPKIPGREKKASLDVASSHLNGQGESKRKAPDEDVEMDVADGTEEAT